MMSVFYLFQGLDSNHGIKSVEAFSTQILNEDNNLHRGWKT